MVFSSEVFLFVFLPIVLIIYYNPIFKKRTFKNVFLLLASLAFYAWGEPIFVFLMIFSIIVTWGLGLLIEKEKGKWVVVVGTIYHVLVLFTFKYLTFLTSQLGLLLNRDFSFIRISLPIGISFFTFQLMSYLFDVYYKKARTQHNPLYVGLYVALFPQLIAGPIVRYESIAYEIENRVETKDDVASGMKRFIYGLAKKVLIANYMAALSDVVFNFDGRQSVMAAWLGAIAYTLQIYFDFSGYSDMAIGLGRMFGFKFDENFNYPYIASNVTDFWRRWHISLSSWFRDYVYIPMGGNRVKKSRELLNLFVVWLLTGIWHGANWTFIAWGLLYFVFLVIERTTGLNKVKNAFTHIYTLLVVIMCWVVFRCDSITQAVRFIGTMVGIKATAFIDSGFTMYIKGSWFILLLAIFGATPLFKKFISWLQKKGLAGTLLEGIYVVAIFFISILKIVSSSYNPFIYFNF
ncbi:MAG: MBOAT family protein [Lachnospiraceae bacterium]|nr:MBOAT family protein [Lachnospiraceae bacterium]